MMSIPKICKMFLILTTMFFYPCLTHAAPPTPDKALALLMEGNNHFVKGELKQIPHVTGTKYKLLENQTPFAVIVGCSDSRVSPEVIFDQVLGEVFVVRVAGNVLGPIEIGSVEFAVKVLKAPLVMVLGHQNCGAVKASLQGSEHIPDFLGAIYPLIKEALNDCDTVGSNALVNAINCNVKNGVGILKKSPIIAPLLEQKKVNVVGAYFNFETGKVNLIAE